MALGTTELLSALEAFAATSNITVVKPSSPEFPAIILCYVQRPDQVPFAVARPSTPEAVAALVKFCTSHELDFVVRNGGHDCGGRSQIDGALTIDMRLLNGVSVSSDRRTADVGGGASVTDVAEALGAEGLVTPTGAIGSVGYVGWASLGGYGGLSANFGLGADQILAARVVNAEGELVDAGEELLKGIRGAGPTFGVVVQLTIKAYPLKQVLAGSVIYDSSDFPATVKKWTDRYNELYSAGLPSALTLQFTVVDIPQLGRSITVLVVWSSPDQEEGRRWVDIVAAMGSPIMNTVAPVAMIDFIKANDALVHYGSHGRTNMVHIRDFTPEIVDVIIRHTNELPGGGAMFTINVARGASMHPDDKSVFWPRTDHQTVELLSVTAREELVPKCDAWARAFKKDFLETAGDGILEGGYVSLLPDEESDPAKIFGGNYQLLLDLKRKYDPRNVFKYAVPRVTA